MARSGQSIIEYLLVAAAVIASVIVITNDGGPLQTALQALLSSAVYSIPSEIPLP